MAARKTRWLCVLSVFCSAVLAQGPGQRPPDQPASPASLPGDTLPPFGMLDHSGKLIPLPPRPAGNNAKGNAAPQRRGPVHTRGPEMALAMEAARAAVENCEAGGYYIGASVIDTSGQPRAMVESDGSDGGHVCRGSQGAGGFSAQDAELPSERGGSKKPGPAFPHHTPDVCDGRRGPDYGRLGDDRSDWSQWRGGRRSG
jgi:hypothetical protein